MFSAFKPLFPSTISKETLSFSAIRRPFNAETCTKISFPVESSVMKPKPLLSLKNFTVPVAMSKKNYLIKNDLTAELLLKITIEIEKGTTR
jgi:hypothetical protein